MYFRKSWQHPAEIFSFGNTKFMQRLDLLFQSLTCSQCLFRLVAKVFNNSLAQLVCWPLSMRPILFVFTADQKQQKDTNWNQRQQVFPVPVYCRNRTALKYCLDDIKVNLVDIKSQLVLGKVSPTRHPIVTGLHSPDKISSSEEPVRGWSSSPT